MTGIENHSAELNISNGSSTIPALATSIAERVTGTLIASGSFNLDIAQERGSIQLVLSDIQEDGTCYADITSYGKTTRFVLCKLSNESVVYGCIGVDVGGDKNNLVILLHHTLSGSSVDLSKSLWTQKTLDTDSVQKILASDEGIAIVHIGNFINFCKQQALKILDINVKNETPFYFDNQGNIMMAGSSAQFGMPAGIKQKFYRALFLSDTPLHLASSTAWSESITQKQSNYNVSDNLMKYLNSWRNKYVTVQRRASVKI